jgi:hypothetical protein
MNLSERIVAQVRTLVGLGSDTPDSAVLTRQLEDLNGRLVSNREKMTELELELPMAVLKSIDAGATERRKLVALRSEREGLTATVSVIEQALSDALKAEADERLVARQQAAREAGKNLIAASEDLKAQIVALVKAASATVAAGNDFIAAMRAIPEPRNAYEPLFFQSLLPMWLNYRRDRRVGDCPDWRIFALSKATKKPGQIRKSPFST